ncbi:GH20644 [Drosophila grimshawi]|uniref:GH20644 n=1 Tax=Drosophila grimshawi TaxID=7222 RepID=B4J7G4_DROGR|nr:GH20644 [Drosophila grimshawi]
MTNHSVLIGLLLLSTLCCLVAADLRADLRDFMALVPRRRINHIAARYYVFDPRFRQAVDFVRSDDFAKTWQQMRKAPDFADLIDYVTEYGSGYDVSSVIDKLPNRLHAYQLSRVVPVDLMLRRDLTTFLHEALQTLPRAQVYSLMARKVREGRDFAKLYKALKDKEFKELVHTARHSQEMQQPLSKLSQKNIDVDEFIQIVFELISWGP